MIQYNPIKISPSRPMSVDVANSLASTLREGNTLARESKNKLNAVIMALPTAPTEEKYKMDKLAELNTQIEDAAMFGNMFFAQDEINAAAEEITKDPIINDSIKSYQNYNTWKQSIQDRTDISQLTKNRIIATNPYTSTADRTSNGQITQWEFNCISPVKDVSINELFDSALKRLNADYLYKEDFVFYDDAGNPYDHYVPGKTIMMINKNTNTTTTLSKETIKEALEAEIGSNPEYRQAIEQQRQNINWYKDQSDYNHQFDSFIADGEVVDYNTYIDRLVNPLVNPVAYKQEKRTAEWDATTIQMNSGNGSKNNGNDEEVSINASGIGINFKGYNETYTNTLTTEVAATKDALDNDISKTLSDLGVNMSNFTVNANNPNDIINHINANENLSPETKRLAIDYVNTAVNYYQAQNTAYNQMLEDANSEGRVTKIFTDSILNNKKINFDDPRFKDIDSETINKYGAIYANAIGDFYTNYERVGQLVNPNNCSKSGVYFKSNKDLNNFISLFGDKKYMEGQGYKIVEQDGYKIVYITNKDSNLVYQFANKIEEYTKNYDDNIYRYFETDTSLLPDSNLYPNSNKEQIIKQHYGTNSKSNAYGDINMHSILRGFNKIKEVSDKEFGSQEVIVTSKISSTPDPILDDRYGAMRFGTEKYTEFKGRLEQISKSLEQGLRQAPTLNMFDVQIGDDETGEYRDVKRKELDKIQSLIRNPNSKIYIAYTSSMNGVTPYCTIMNEDGSEQYNFTLNGWLEDDVLKNLNEDIRYTYIANNYAYAGYDIQIGLSSNNQAISLRAENNNDDTFSFYLVDNNGKEIDGIKLDSYDAATLKRCYDALRPYIDKQYTKEGLTQEDYNNIEYLTNVFNHTLISNYAKNTYNLDIKTEKQIEDFLEKINATEENWLNVGGVSPVNAFLGAIGLTYSAQ